MYILFNLIIVNYAIAALILSLLSQYSRLLSPSKGRMQLMVFFLVHLCYALGCGAACLAFSWSVGPSILHARREREYAMRPIIRSPEEGEVAISRRVPAGPNSPPGSVSHVTMYSYNQALQRGYHFTWETTHEDGLVEKVIGDNVQWNAARKTWTVANAVILRKHLDGEWKRGQRGTLDTAFALLPEDLAIRRILTDGMTMEEINNSIAYERMMGAGLERPYQQEKYSRYSLAAGVFLLQLTAFSLHSRHRRKGLIGHLGIGFAALAIFMLAYFGSAHMPLEWQYEPHSAWLPILLLLPVSLYLLIRRLRK